MTRPGKAVPVDPSAAAPRPGGEPEDARELFEAADPVDVQALLSHYPQLKTDRQLVLDLAYEEYCQRLEAGEELDPDAFCEAFPSFKTSLRRVLEAHAFLEEQTTGGRLAPWPEPGQPFLGFVLRSELGRGAFARVFLANEPALGNRVVVLKVTLLGPAEAETLGRLSHPHVVPVYSVQHDAASGLTAICMPYLGSTTLEDVLDALRTGPGLPRDAAWILKTVRDQTRPTLAHAPAADSELDAGSYVDGVVHIGLELAEALAFVHSQGLCHQDLKPSNVLMRPDGRSTLLDFNLSVASEGPGPYVGGTLPYMAPEQLLATDGTATLDLGPVGPASDLFSLGLILYELLTGRHPFGPIPEGGSSRQLRADLLARQQRGPRPLLELNPRVNRALSTVIGRCLAFQPADRPASAGELAAALRHLARRRRARRWIARHAGASLVIAVLVLAAGSAGTFALAARDPAGVRALRQGQRAYQEQRYEEAVACSRQALADRAGLGEALLGQALFLQGQACERLAPTEPSYANQAYSCFLEAKKHLKNGEALASIGYFMNRQHLHREAIDCYERAVKDGFATAAVFNNLGYSYLRQHDYTKARLQLTRAIEREPTLQAAYHNRAGVGLERLLLSELPGKARLSDAEARQVFEEALADIRKAIALGPPSADRYYHAARLCMLAYRREPAWGPQTLAYLEKALEQGKPPKYLRADSLFADLAVDPVTAPRFRALCGWPPPPIPAANPMRLLDPAPVVGN